MRFVWMGFFKPGAEPLNQEIQRQLTSYLQQPYIKILSAGPLVGPDGGKAGMMMTFEADSHAQAEGLVHDSPLRRAGLYDHFHLYEHRNEVGS